jgi:hypothetical protein
MEVFLERTALIVLLLVFCMDSEEAYVCGFRYSQLTVIPHTIKQCGNRIPACPWTRVDKGGQGKY